MWGAVAKQLLSNPKTRKIIIIAAVGLLGFQFLFMFLIICAVAYPIFAVGEFIQNFVSAVEDFFQRFGNFITFNGWKTNEEKYFEFMEELSCENATIISSTVMYYYNIGQFESEEMSDEEWENYDPSTSNGDDDLPYGDLLKDAKKLNKYYKKGMTEYETYVKTKFIPSYDKNANVDSIYDAMMTIAKTGNCSKGSSSGSSGFYSVTCSGVTVTGEGAGTYQLEDYVAGVVDAEVGVFGESAETLKAQAIAARTYVLNTTNNCANPINNSTTAQTFSPNPSEAAKQAANETAGKVLTFNGSIFKSEYDSFCSNCDSTTTNEDGSYTAQYTKLPNNETHSVTLGSSYASYIAGGHGRGMSQVLAYQLANEGKTYAEILEYFYSPGVVIANSGGFSTGGWTIRNTTPTKSDTLYTGYANVGQCVWYAKSRAMEILTELKNAGKIDSEQADKAIQSLNSTYGNATDWYKNTSDKFNKISDITKPQAGSIIVWSGGNGHNYGHVAIIEEINTEENTITVTDTWSNLRDGNGNIDSCPGTWTCIVFNSKTYSLDDFINNYAPHGGGYKRFVGYVNFVNSEF